MERVKGIEPSCQTLSFFVFENGAFTGVFEVRILRLLALLALGLAYLYRKPRSPFWYVVYLDGDQQ